MFCGMQFRTRFGQDLRPGICALLISMQPLLLYFRDVRRYLMDADTLQARSAAALIMIMIWS